MHVCTDAGGKSSFQDKPCDMRDAAPQFAPVKAGTATEAGAIETMKRLSGAMGARDVVALQRLLAHQQDPAVLNSAQLGLFLTRALQAAKNYRIQRSCNRDTAQESAGALALRCSYTDRIEVMNRVVESGGEELVRIAVENGELKLVELSELKAAEALRNRTAQASR